MDNLYKLKADVSIGRLLDLAPALRTIFKRGISKESRFQRVRLAKTAKKLSTEEDHILPVVVDSLKLFAMLDGGVNCNLITSQFVRSTWKKRIVKTDFIIKPASDSILQPDGIIHDLPIEINGMTMKIDVLVASNVEYQMILGKPFLKAASAVTFWMSEEQILAIYDNQLWIDCKTGVESRKHELGVRLVQVSSQPEAVAKRILDEFNDIFADDLVEVQHTNVAFHKIGTGEAEQIRVKLRRFSPKKNDEIVKQLNSLSMAY